MISHWATDTARYSAMRRLAAGIMHKVRLSGLHLQEEQAALVGCRLRRLQAPPPGTDGAKLGSRDGLPVQQTRAISARLDGLLRDTLSITDRFQNWMNGYADVYACATGNSGARPTRRSATFWHRASTSGRRLLRESAVKATGICRGQRQRKSG